MPDDIARLSDDMARDPGGMAWVALADALRRARRVADAERVAVRGLGRHPYHADGHDVLARIAADSGDHTRARDEWEMTLRLDGRHVGAQLGMGWLALAGGDRASALRWWQKAQASAPGDPRIEAAGRQLAIAPAASPVPAPARARASRELFDEIERGGAHLALLVDDDGLVLAGQALAPSGGDRSDELGAELCGLSGDAERALSQLQLGSWERLLVECESGTLALGPVSGGAIALIATAAATPAGLPRLLLDRARRSAGHWLETL